MTLVGLIANPAAGKDIRRLVAHASTFDNNEKVNILRRVLLGLDACGVERILIMPDYYGIGTRALRGLELAATCSLLDMKLEFGQGDSTRAANHLTELGATCIVTLGGDGTNRAVAKGCGDIPLVPISTGTNNVFPRMIEGTVAGIAAGVVARGVVPIKDATTRTLRLEILRGEEMIDIALIDVVSCAERFTGSRAIWEESSIRQIITTCPRADQIGFSSVAAYLAVLACGSNEGIALEIGDDTQQVLAPIAPGLIRPLGIKAHQRLSIGHSVPVYETPAVLALDGEREISVAPGEQVRVRVSGEGPRVVNVRQAIELAAGQGFFRREGGAGS